MLFRRLFKQKLSQPKNQLAKRFLTCLFCIRTYQTAPYLKALLTLEQHSHLFCDSSKAKAFGRYYFLLSLIHVSGRHFGFRHLKKHIKRASYCFVFLRHSKWCHTTEVHLEFSIYPQQPLLDLVRGGGGDTAKNVKKYLRRLQKQMPKNKTESFKIYGVGWGC